MRRPRLVVALAIAVAATAALSSAVFASVNDVRLGNFYFEDATVGDGKIEIRQGDQLRFIAEDNGPGTPHTVDVDELGIHSGGLATGTTFTTPVINQTGSFSLYCKFHRNSGHATTLIVRSSSTSTSTTRPTASTTTTTTRPSTIGGTPSASTTSSPSSGVAGGSPTSGSVSSTTVVDGETATSALDGEEPTDGGPTSAVDGNERSEVDQSDTVPSGLGQLSEDELAAIPAAEGSLESILGRAPASRGPWTRSLRMTLLGAIPLVAMAAVAVQRQRKLAAASISTQRD